MDFRVRRSMRIARFRPQYVEGEAVATEAHLFTYKFPYFPLEGQEEQVPDQIDNESNEDDVPAPESAAVQE